MSASYEIGDFVELECWSCHITCEMRVTEIQKDVDQHNDETAFAECPYCGALNEP